MDSHKNVRLSFPQSRKISKFVPEPRGAKSVYKWVFATPATAWQECLTAARSLVTPTSTAPLRKLTAGSKHLFRLAF